MNDGAVKAGWELGRAAWPDLVVSADEFATYVAARVGDADLAKLHFADLYLTCACVRGDQRAIGLFDARYIPEVAKAMKSATPATIDETKQILRQRFFVSEDGSPPKIGEYTGRGELKAWVRAAAVRAGWRADRKPKGQTEVESHVFHAVAAAGDDLELDYLKRRYLGEFEQALRDAFKALPVRDRNISRYYYGKGLSIDAIGALYDVHRSTVARWLNKITSELVETTRKRMMDRLSANKDEVASLVRMLESRIDMTLRVVVGSVELSKSEDE